MKIYAVANEVIEKIFEPVLSGLRSRGQVTKPVYYYYNPRTGSSSWSKPPYLG